MFYIMDICNEHRIKGNLKGKNGHGDWFGGSGREKERRGRVQSFCLRILGVWFRRKSLFGPPSVFLSCVSPLPSCGTLHSDNFWSPDVWLIFGPHTKQFSGTPAKCPTI